VLIVLVAVPMAGSGVSHHEVRGFKVQFVTAASLLVVVIIKTIFFWAFILV
jgi:hypothetical protein